MIKVVSLFSGCGGFDKGLEMGGATTIFACDIFGSALDTFQSNFSNATIIKKDIKLIDDFPDADIVIGGFPCQGFSVAGNRILNDPRNFLYREYVRVLSIIKPKFFIAENVKGLLTMNNGNVILQMIEDFKSIGYNVSYRLYNAKNLGIPQDRERVFIVGVRYDIDFKYNFPEETHGKGKLPFKTMRDTISHLPLDPIGEYDDSGFSTRYMSRNRKRNWDEPSFCIQASGRHSPLHPHGSPMLKIDKDQWVFTDSFNRKLSYKECALLQTFPEEFIFKGNLSDKYKQIGNAVPPLLAMKIFLPIKEFFGNI